MNREDKIVESIYEFVYKKLNSESSGHDFWHTVRVRNTAKTIAKNEKANIFICEVAALVHDLIDDKLASDIRMSLDELVEYLGNLGLEPKEIEEVIDIITKMSFKGGLKKEELTLEGKVVQDADRLDAIGAIGVARTMCYSGYTGRIIHDPNAKVRENMTVEEYRNGDSTAIIHFYEKLLKLKDLINTPHAKKLAEERHKFMEDYLEQFYAEWRGER